MSARLWWLALATCWTPWPWRSSDAGVVGAAGAAGVASARPVATLAGARFDAGRIAVVGMYVSKKKRIAFIDRPSLFFLKIRINRVQFL